MHTRFFFALFLLLFLVVVNAGSTIELSIGKWSFEDLNATNVQVDIALTAKGLALTAQAESVKLPSPIGKLTKLNLHCDELILLSARFSCGRGNISFDHRELGQQNISFKVNAEPDQGKYQVNISGFKLAAATFSATFYINKNYWRLITNTAKLNITELITVASPYLSVQQHAVLENWQVDGNIKLAADIAGSNDEINTVEVKLTTTTLNLTDSESRYVTENVIMVLTVDAHNDKQNWQWQTDLAVGKGQAYGEPIFIDFDMTPVTVTAKGLWQQDNGYLVVEYAQFNQQDVVQVTADFKGSFEKIDLLNISVSKTEAASLYQHWLQPFVLGTAIDSLDLTGKVALNYHQNMDDYHVSLDLHQLFIDDKSERFLVNNINGSLGWTNYNYPIMSKLQWDKAIIYAIPLGGSQFQAQTVTSSLTLTQPWSIPIFDGGLEINTLSLQRPSDQRLQWTFDGKLTAISMEQVSSTLGWPLLHGKLSGVIPKVSYSKENITVDGALTVKLFEGTTIISNLQLAQPFGSLPQLYADFDLQDMNLSTLSKTFDFGEISGRLEGKIHNLRLANWRPVQFDAAFATPQDDKSRRRISQQAINNLSRVGGGVGGALQRSFLRFFEDFSYQRLGLSCKLHNEVCEMAGVGEAENGYYIVKGGGLPPRINVVGHTRRVDWPDLIERLKAVSESSGPIVIE